LAFDDRRGRERRREDGELYLAAVTKLARDYAYLENGSSYIK
jgi:hypothetical protein